MTDEEKIKELAKALAAEWHKHDLLAGLAWDEARNADAEGDRSDSRRLVDSWNRHVKECDAIQEVMKRCGVDALLP